MGGSRLLQIWAFVRSSKARSWVVLGLDAIATLAALQTAFLLRFEGQVPAEYAAHAPEATLLLIVLRLGALYRARLHRWSFRMSGLSEGLRLVVALAAGSVLFVAFFHLFWDVVFPPGVLAIEFFVSLALTSAFRFTPRMAAAWLHEQARARTAARSAP
ncbi:MAG: hypothetical protein U0229_09510 [Anaeromyxobacter sp.]